MTLAEELKVDQAAADSKAALNTALKQLAKAKAKTEDLVDAVYRSVRDALVADPPRPVQSPAKIERKGKPEVALWMLTDWQGAKVTPSYNSEIMGQRIVILCQTLDIALSIRQTPDTWMTSCERSSSART